MTTAFCALLGACNQAPPGAPAAPSALSVAAVGGYPRILVTWEDGARTATVTVERSPDNATWATVATVKRDVQRFQDGSLTPGSQYYYQLTGSNIAGDSAPTSSASATVFDVLSLSPTLVLEASSGLKKTPGGTAATAANDAVQQWQDRSGNTHHFAETTHNPTLKFDSGMPTVSFDGTEWLTNSDTWTFLHDGNPNTVVVLFKPNDDTQTDYTLLGNSNFGSTRRGLSIELYNPGGSTLDAAFVQISNGSNNAIQQQSQSGFFSRNDWNLYTHRYEYGHSGPDLQIDHAGEFLSVESAHAPSASAPTYNLQIGAAGNNALPAKNDYYAVLVFPSFLSDADLLRVKEYLWSQAPTLFAVQADHFLNLRHVESTTLKPTFGVLTKSVSNPVVAAGLTWDKEIDDVAMLYESGTYHFWYPCLDDSGNLNIAYATSTDLATSTKPTLHLVTYAGNTNNNIVLADYFGVAVAYAPDDATYYMTVGITPTRDTSSYLLSSTDKVNWTYLGAIHSEGSGDGLGENHGLFYRPIDGRLINIVTDGHASENRHLTMYVNDDPDDHNSAYHRLGGVLGAVGANYQFYSSGCAVIDGVYYYLVAVYNKSTEEIMQIDLYTSISALGLEMELVKADVLHLGASGEWDDSMIVGCNLVDDGSDLWKFAYNGFPELHNASFPPARGGGIGIATVPVGRFGGVVGTGELITQPLYIDSGQTLYINANASGGSLKVELLDADGTPITDYTEAEFDPITSNEFNLELTWDDTSAPTGGLVRLRFLSVNASVYGYRVA